MKEQKLLITDSTYDVNEWLDKGWEVISVTAQHVSSGNYTERGKFAILIQKQNLKS